MDHKQVLAFTTVRISSYFLRWGPWSLRAKGNEWIQSCWRTLSNAPHIADCLRALQHDTRAAFNTSGAGPGSSFCSQVISLETSVPLSTWASLLEHVCTWKCFPWVCLAAILPRVCTVLTWTSPFFFFTSGCGYRAKYKKWEISIAPWNSFCSYWAWRFWVLIRVSQGYCCPVFLRTGFL